MTAFWEKTCGRSPLGPVLYANISGALLRKMLQQSAALCNNPTSRANSIHLLVPKAVIMMLLQLLVRAQYSPQKRRYLIGVLIGVEF